MVNFLGLFASSSPLSTAYEHRKGGQGCGDGNIGLAHPTAENASAAFRHFGLRLHRNSNSWSFSSFGNVSRNTTKYRALFCSVLLLALLSASCDGSTPAPIPTPTVGDVGPVVATERARATEAVIARSFSPTPRPTAPPTEAPTPEPPISFAGPSDLKTPPFTLAGGTYAVSFTITGPAQGPCLTTGIRLQRTDDPKPGIFTGERITSDSADAGEVISQTTYLYNVAPGEYYIDATTRCAWTVQIARQ